MPRLCSKCGHKVIIGQGRWEGVDLYHKTERLCQKAKSRSDNSVERVGPLIAARIKASKGEKCTTP